MTIYEKILAEMQTKFQGADPATLNRIATAKATGITDEAQVKTIVDGVSWSDVMTSYADFRANEATRTSIANYEKKHNVKDGKPVEEHNENPPSPPTPPKDGGTPDIAKLIQEGITSALKPVTEKLSALENEKIESDFNTRVLETAKKYGISDNLVKMLNVPKDADLDTFMKNTKQEFNNEGFNEVLPPDSAEQQNKKESETIAEQLNKETEAMVEKESKK